MIQLYQFYFSHYCEKARWALDYKKLPYAPRNLLPGLHVKPALKLAPQTCLPILVDGDTTVQDSTAIIDFLDRKYPHHPLTPADPAQAKEALAWEEYLDEEIGVTMRLWVYYRLLPDRERAIRFMLGGAPWYGRLVLGLMFPKLRERMTQLLGINVESARQSEERLLAALEKLDEALADRRFLAGERFSRADLTACALLEPYCRPGESDAQAARILPEYVLKLRDSHKTRRYFAWVREIYAEHRHPSRAESNVAA